MAKKKEASSETGIVSWEEMMKDEAKEVAKVERPSVGRISLASGVMSYQDQAVPDNTLECIVADVIHEQVMYLGDYVAGVVNPPDCFAFGEVGTNLKAHESVPERDDEGWPDCYGCANNKFGSSTKGSGKGKACGDRRKLAILPLLEDVEAYKKAEIAVLSLPVMSVKNWGNYVNGLSAQFQRPCWGMVTRILLKPDPKSQYKVHFEPVAPLGEEYLGVVHSLKEVCRSTLMVPYDLEPGNGEETKDSGKF